ncbi:hypothetical protein M514_10797 [Trichuris suis]|uniref:Peptidase A2 domain-containing protein n=1 Tax=Trichuris suis TaxID=68888 RepID=A0A085N4S3_9BILA|nr:hypothetical protein M514_10797 [Trichuris suis]
MKRNVLVDTGSSKCIIHNSSCKDWKRKKIKVTAVDGNELRCEGEGVVHVQPSGRSLIHVEAIVVATRPLGFEFILGMNGIVDMGGVAIDHRRRVKFRVQSELACAVADGEIKSEEPDFTPNGAYVDRAVEVGPEVLRNTVEEYPPATEAREPLDEEL